MEEKQNFPRATGFSGKILIALLFILSGILLFARNMGWITSEVFDLIVSWHSLLILLGIYAMIRRHFIGGIILFLAGVYFLIGGLSWLPENSQAMVWPLALIIAGVLFIFKPGRNKRAQWARQHTMEHRRQWMKMHQGRPGMNFESEQQQSESVDGFLRSENVFLHQQPNSPEYPIQREKLKLQKQHTQMEIHQWRTLPIYPKMFRSLTTRHLFERLPGIPAA